MTFDVRFSAAAEDDLARPFDFLLDKAETLEDLDMAQAAIEAAEKLANDPCEFDRLTTASRRLNETIFNPDRLQEIFVYEIEKVVENFKNKCLKK